LPIIRQWYEQDGAICKKKQTKKQDKYSLNFNMVFMQIIKKKRMLKILRIKI